MVNSHLKNTLELDNISIATAYSCDTETCNKFITNTINSFNIVTQNIRSIYKNFDKLIAQLSMFTMDIDIIILTECWLNDRKPIPQMENYIAFSNSKFFNQNDGIVTYVKNNLRCTVTEPEPKGATFLLLDLEPDIHILAIYRSPSLPSTDILLNTIDEIIRPLHSKKNIILAGDLNIDIKRNNIDKHSATYLDLSAELGLLPGHQYPTRLRNCLDHIMLKTIFPASVFVTDSTITDHALVLLNLSLTKHKPVTDSHFKRIDFEAAIKYLTSVDFSFVTPSCDANVAATSFVEKLSIAITSNSKIYKVPNRKKTLKPWITSGLLRCIRHRDRLHKNVKKDPNNNILETIYKRYRNYCNSLLRKLKINYEKSLLISSKSNKETWNAIKSILDISKSKNTADDLLRLDGSNDIQDINTYFSNVGKQLADAIISSVNCNMGKYNSGGPQATNSIVLLSPDEAEIESLIINLKNDCAVGWDSIPVKFLKLAKHIIVPPLTKIIELCLSQGIFPKAFKRSLITPVHKGGSRDSVTNYRPISVLSSLSKVLEKVINNRLINFLEHNNLLSSSQFGFRPNMSTEDAVSQLIAHVTSKCDAGQKCLGIFLDLAKAFDTVAIPILVDKLDRIGVRGDALGILKDFLCDRTQQVKIGQMVSAESPVTYGVPQGSILGPSLFLVYINDLCRMALQNTKIFTYADDTALVFTGRTWDEVRVTAERGLRSVSCWLRENLLTLNLSKSTFLQFTPPNNNPANIVIKLHTCSSSLNSDCTCLTVAKSSNVKYLGVILDDRLSWRAHIEFTTSRIRKLIYVFKKLRYVADFGLLRKIYYALAESVLRYCVGAWGGACKTHVLALERAQRSLLKVMSFSPFRLPTTTLYEECKVLSVRQLFVLQSVMKQHKVTPYNKDSYNEKRTRTNVCSFVKCRTAWARRQLLFMPSYLYNKTNKTLNIYPLPACEAKLKIKNWILTLDYDETEALLQ